MDLIPTFRALIIYLCVDFAQEVFIFMSSYWKEKKKYENMVTEYKKTNVYAGLT